MSNIQDCEDITNKKMLQSLTLREIMALLVAFAGIVTAWTVFGEDIKKLKEADQSTSEQIVAVKQELKEIKKDGVQTKLDVREIRTSQQHLSRDVQRILTILEDRDRDRNRNRDTDG